MLLEPFLRQCRQQPEAIALVEMGAGYLRTIVGNNRKPSPQACKTEGVKPGQPVAIHLERGIDATLAIVWRVVRRGLLCPARLKKSAAPAVFHNRRRPGLGSVGFRCHARMAGREALAGPEACPPAHHSGRNSSRNAGRHPIYLRFHRPSPWRSLKPRRGGCFRPMGRRTGRLAERRPHRSPARRSSSIYPLSTFTPCWARRQPAFSSRRPDHGPGPTQRVAKAQVISGWYTVPSLLAFLAYKGNLAQTPLASLRFLFFAGEVFPSPALMNLAANCRTRLCTICLAPPKPMCAVIGRSTGQNWRRTAPSPSACLPQLVNFASTKPANYGCAAPAWRVAIGATDDCSPS